MTYRVKQKYLMGSKGRLFVKVSGLDRTELGDAKTSFQNKWNTKK